MPEFEITLKCGTRLSRTDLETARLSYVPCGQVNSKDQPLLKFSSLWGQRRRVGRDTYGKQWNAFTTKDMTGVQIMTGKPTYKRNGKTGYLYFTSLDIEHRMIEKYPDAVAQIRTLYEGNIIGTPCVIKTKSDGLRLDAYTEYVGKKMSFKDDEKKMLFEVLADKCLTRIDARYAMISGSILDIPTLPKSTLQEIYHIIAGIAANEQSDSKPREIVDKSQLGDLDIEWDADGRSQLFPTEYCQRTSHTSNRHEVRFTKHADGSVDGKCFNCGESWWEIAPVNPAKGLIERAPPVEIRETPSFPYFSQEERKVVDEVLGISPDAGWHGPTPIWTTKYERLHPLTNKFALNGQPSEVEMRRAWSTLFGNCEICGAVTARWVDRYDLTAGRYCDGCHKDYHLGSYLELELNRKLPNSIVSEYQGFLGKDPEFADFRLWEPGMMTHLGAAMATGKTTEIDNRIIELAMQGLGKGIIAVPRISLARFLAHYLRKDKKHGYRSWGLWHEGGEKSDKFIGEFGAIVCLPSLPRAVESANNDGIKRLYIAIDEIDFGYNLLSLSIEQATAVKKCLRDTLASTGLVVSGQTESTLALEALADELECEQVQGFYNTAKPADGSVVMHKHPNIEGKSNSLLCDVIDDISDALSARHNVYAFCSSRRDGDVIADEFRSENPVIYNAYTKGDRRADAVLKNQKLTDSRLFIGTSAAGVGISIHDPKARTVIASGLLYGSRDASMVGQQGVRDRGRCGILLHYAEYELPLPVRPTENEKVSIYHEAVKQASARNTHLSTAGIRKIAYAQALASLADAQIEAFISHHLGTVGNMPVYHASALGNTPERIESISTRRTKIRRAEREKRITDAVNLLTQRNILTTSEIRVLSNKGRLSLDARLAHETANAVAQAVGWDDKSTPFNPDDPAKDVLNNDDLDIAIRLAEENISFDKLTKQRRGYIAVHFPNWTAYAFQTALANAESDLVNDGLGVEPMAIKDDRFRGELLQVLLDRFVGNVFDLSSLATAVREVLKTTRANGQTFIGEIHRGALGASESRKARFLAHADDDRIVDWASQFIAEWYPSRIQKRDDHFALTHAENLELRLASFQRWLIHQPSPPDNMPTDLDISFQSTEIPDPDADLKNVVQFRREGGETIKSIAESLNRNPRTISKWCEGIKPPSPSESEVLGILRDGKVWKTPDIVERSRFRHQNVSTAIKKLLDTGAISRIKRGHYQKK